MSPGRDMQAKTKQRLLILLIISVYIFFFLPILLVDDINDPEYMSNDLRHNIHQFRAVFDDPLNSTRHYLSQGTIYMIQKKYIATIHLLSTTFS